MALLLAFCTEGRAKTLKPPARITSLAEHKKQVAADPRLEMVDLSQYVPGIHIDLRYASKHNFMKKPLYSEAKALVRRPVAEALKRVQEELEEKGYALKIWDAYRPYSVTLRMWNENPSPYTRYFLAAPHLGSRHNRGISVDATLVDLETGREVEMPTGFDEFSKKAFRDDPRRSAAVRRNFGILRTAMERQGFRTLESEWWDFSLRDKSPYPILDIPINQLP